MGAVQITEFGGPEVLNVVDLPDPTPGEGEQLFEVSTAGVHSADTHHDTHPQLWSKRSQRDVGDEDPRNPEPAAAQLVAVARI